MTRSVKGHIMQNSKFSFPFRMILAGSSESGKSYFAGKLLEKIDLFDDNVSAVFYYYPCYLNEAPVKWHRTLHIPVSYHIGLPTKIELANLPKKSCVVIDDSFDEAIKSSAIDHLFRVISGKRKICVIIMTQNNFTKGKYGREIRNSCNFSVLFRNCCDVSINENITRMAGMKKAFDAASIDVEGCKYPYFFLDQSQQGQLTRFRLYTDILSNFHIAWSLEGMKAYIVAAQDFEQYFDVISEGSKFSARENVDEKSKTKYSKSTERENRACQSAKKRMVEVSEVNEYERNSDECIEQPITVDHPTVSKNTSESESEENSETGEREDSSQSDSEQQGSEQDSEQRGSEQDSEQQKSRDSTRPIRRERFLRRQRFRRFV